MADSASYTILAGLLNDWLYVRLPERWVILHTFVPYPR